MKFTVREIDNPTTILDIGTENNEIDGPDSCAAALNILNILGLMLVRVDDPVLTQLTCEILPSGMMTEENAAKYIGYSKQQLREKRGRSKSVANHVGRIVKCPRYYKKHGKVHYRKADLDTWLMSPGRYTDKIAAYRPIWIPKAIRAQGPEAIEKYRAEKRAEKKKALDSSAECDKL